MIRVIHHLTIKDSSNTIKSHMFLRSSSPSYYNFYCCCSFCDSIATEQFGLFHFIWNFCFYVMYPYWYLVSFTQYRIYDFAKLQIDIHLLLGFHKSFPNLTCIAPFIILKGIVYVLVRHQNKSSHTQKRQNWMTQENN